MNKFPKTLLLLMTFSIFFALFQVLLKSEGKTQSPFKAVQKTELIHKETVRKESEPIPQFVKRFQSVSFDLWERSYPLNKKKTIINESTKSNQK